MCSQNAGNVISEPPILKISPGPPIRVAKYEPMCMAEALCSSSFQISDLSSHSSASDVIHER